MNNQLYGTLTVVFSVIVYSLSWRYQSKGNFKLAVLLLIIGGLALRIFTSADFLIHEWDEKFHALAAKNLINHPLFPTLYDNPLLPYNYKDWVGNFIWLHKPPLPLYTMAGSMALFGINEFEVRLPSVIFTTLGIYLTYYIGNYFFNKKTGYLAAFLYSINGLIIEITAGRVPTDHIDIFFLFFVELAIFFIIVYAKKKKTIYNILAGICIGAAVLSKWLPAYIVLPLWLFIIIDSKNFERKTIVLQFFLLIIVSLIIFLPWQFYIYHYYPLEASYEASLNFQHITQNLDNQGRPFYWFISVIRINYGELIYVPLIWFIWTAFRKPRDYKRLAILTWFIIPLIFFSVVITKMQGFILFTAPALFIIASEFWYFLYEHSKNKKHKWFYVLILILLIALPVRYTFERTKPFLDMNRNPQWVTDLKNLNDKNISRGILFNYEKPIEAMFYTNLTVYPYIPEKDKIISLIKEGYKIYINDIEKAPKDIQGIEGVTPIHLTVGK
jgi:4-amino-4-deoxy-L-arabinose transferase-like glycosyltransferase